MPDTTQPVQTSNSNTGLKVFVVIAVIILVIGIVGAWVKLSFWSKDLRSLQEQVTVLVNTPKPPVESGPPGQCTCDLTAINAELAKVKQDIADLKAQKRTAPPPKKKVKVGKVKRYKAGRKAKQNSWLPFWFAR